MTVFEKTTDVVISNQGNCSNFFPCEKLQKKIKIRGVGVYGVCGKMAFCNEMLQVEIEIIG